MSIKFEDITPELLYDLSREVVKEYPIDPMDLDLDEDGYLKLVCFELLEKYSELDGDDRQIAMLSSNVALVLENFILNLKLMRLSNKHQ